MSRRLFLKNLLSAGFVATACKGVGLLIGDSDNPQPENAQTDNPAKNHKQNTDPATEADHITRNAQIISEKYQITPEAAQRLRNAVFQHKTNSVAAGVGGSALHFENALVAAADAPNEAQRIHHEPSLAGSLLSGWSINEVFLLVSSNDLSTPAFVEREYGMSKKNAEQFCDDYNRDLRVLSAASGTGYGALRLLTHKKQNNSADTSGTSTHSVPENT